MEDKLKILLCEDDENLGMLLREYLQAKGYVAELCAEYLRARRDDAEERRFRTGSGDSYG